MKITDLDKFYQETSFELPENIPNEIGHFNVFHIADVMERAKKNLDMPYNRRAYYKISLIRGRNRAEYADKVIEIEQNALLFATPKIPYHYVPRDEKQAGAFCIFTEDFLSRNQTGMVLEQLPLFKPGAVPIFELSDQQADDIAVLFGKMFREIASDYRYKYDLLRNYVQELIHEGQKLQPLSAEYPLHSASSRISTLFMELLERQFPVEPAQQRLALRTAKDYADRLAVHVNHLNKVLKEQTGKTTTEWISARVLQEAKILLRQTDRSISDIAYSLGFEELSHFSNFVKKQTSLAPHALRTAPVKS